MLSTFSCLKTAEYLLVSSLLCINLPHKNKAAISKCKTPEIETVNGPRSTIWDWQLDIPYVTPAESTSSYPTIRRGEPAFRVETFSSLTLYYYFYIFGSVRDTFRVLSD